MELITLTAEKLALRYRGALQANMRLKEAIDDLIEIKKTNVPNVHIDPEHEEKYQRMVRTYRNSTIKLFELSLDTSWKYIKEFLWAIHGIDQASPKDVMRACLQLDLITTEQTATTLDMIDDRNRAAHAYSENFSNRICEKIPTYHALIQTLLDHAKI